MDRVYSVLISDEFILRSKGKRMKGRRGGEGLEEGGRKIGGDKWKSKVER